MENKDLLNSTIWWVLSELKKEELITKDGYLVKFIYATNPSFPRMDERRSLNWLENQNAIKIEKNLNGNVFDVVAITMGEKEPPGVAVSILKSNFDNIFKEYQKKFQKVKLNGAHIFFNEDGSEIIIDDLPCPVPPHKNEYYLCKVMINMYDAQKFIDWSEIYEEMMGVEIQDKEKNRRSVQDAMYALNNRVKKEFNVEEELFSWQNNNIKRNY